MNSASSVNKTGYERNNQNMIIIIPEKVDKDQTWNWLVRSDLMVETGALLCAAQEHAIRTNYVKHHIKY